MKELTPQIQEHMNQSFYFMFKEFLKNNIEIKLAVYNHNDWDLELPEDLKNSPNFILSIDGDTLASAEFFEEDGFEFVSLTTDFGGTVYSKTFGPHDIAGFVDFETNKPYLIKPFRTEPNLVIQREIKKYDLSEDDLQNKNIINSMNKFAKNNPELFETTNV